MKKLVSSFLVMSMLLSMSSVGAISNTSSHVGGGDTQSSSPEEMVYLNSYGGTQRKIDFDDHWKFYYGDVGTAQTPAFNDSTWRDVNLPHDYSIEQKFTPNGEAESGYLLGGVGWYRKSFTLSPEWANKEISIDFDGVYMNSTVWLNGVQLGTHPFGYTPFSFPLPSNLLKFDGVNVIAVKVDHQTPSSRWYSGSGIYRDVTLTVTEPIHVAQHGVTVTTPNIETEYASGTATAHVETMVCNDGDAAEVTVKHTVYQKGSIAPVAPTTTTPTTTIAAGATQKITADLSVSNPQLWAIEKGNLYTVRTEVLVDGAVRDTYDTDFGFRWFDMDANQGFSLNGELMKLQGVCMHHDQGALGAEAWYRAIERQVEILQEMGCNAIRVTHNPAAAALIEICNEKGMLLIEEIFDGWELPKNGNSNDFSVSFNKKIETDNTIMGGIPNTMSWAEFDLKAMVTRGKNSPAIIMWSLGNEIQEGSGSNANYDQVIAPNLIRWTQEVDSTRMVTIGDNTFKGGVQQRFLNIFNQLSEAGGAAGFNYCTESRMDELHSAYPDWTMYGSETASHTNSRGVYDRKTNNSDGGKGDRRLTSYDNSAVGWGARASSAWYTAIVNDYNAGEFVWTGFDYIGEPTPWNGTGTGAIGGWPSPKSSYFGIIETTGFPKDNFWFYQSQWNHNVNTLHMLPTWNRDEIMVGTDGTVEVVVYSDAAKVELYLTDKQGTRTKVGEQSYFTRESDTGLYTYQSTAETGGNDRDLYMTFQVPYQEGTLEAVAYDKDGKVITNTEGRASVTTTGHAEKLAATADRTEIEADGKDLCYVTIDVQDVKGNFINGAEPTIKLSIEGDGVIVGTDSGFQNDHSSYQATSKAAFNGKLLAIVQSTKNAGSFTLTAQADGLQSSSVTVTTTAMTGSGEKTLTSYHISKNYYVKLGNMPILPAAITAQYFDGTSTEFAVKWEAIDESKLNTIGTFAVSGTLVGTPYIATVNINMLEELAALLNYSTALQLGATLKLPESRPAVMSDGTILEAEFPVTWNLKSFDADEEGIYVIPGTAQVLGKKLTLTATVRVSADHLTVGSNVFPAAADLTQSISQEHQSDTLEAIRDGVKTVNTRALSSVYWSNYDAAQQGQSENTITLRYDTAQNVGMLKLWFYTDNNAFTLPDGVKLEWSINGTEWTDIKAKFTDEAATNGVIERTYHFTAVPEVFFRMTITNRAGRNPTSLKQYATALVEAELYTSLNSFPVSSSDALTAITVNGVEATAQEMTNRSIKTPAYFVETLDVKSNESTAYTVLPIYEKVVRILTESEDHSNRGVYEIKLAQNPDASNPNDDSRDYPYAKTTATAGSNLIVPSGGEGPANFATDGNLGTLWHSNWSTDTAENPADLTNKPESRWFTMQLEEATKLGGLRYLPRTGASNGRINSYKIEISMTGEPNSWSEVATGTWANNSEWKIATFAPVEAKYVRIWGVTTYGDFINKFMSAREMRVCLAREAVDISAATVSFDAPSFDYTGSHIEPRPNVLLNGRRLVYGIDYTVSYSENIDPGTVTCTVTGILTYSGTATGSFVINEAALTVLSYTEETVKTVVGAAPTLPTKVTGLTNAGTSLLFDVIWDTIDPSEYAKRGSFVVEGSVANQGLKPTVTVSVVDALAAQTVSAVVAKGFTPVLPQMLTVYLSDGTTGEYPVTWSSGNYSENATVIVEGTVDLGHGTTIDTTASVRVADGTATDNIALNGSNHVFPLALAYISAGNNNPYAAIDGEHDMDSRWSDWESGKYHTDPKTWLGVAPAGTSSPDEYARNAKLELTSQLVNQIQVVFTDEKGSTAGSVTFPADYDVQYYTGVDTMTVDTRISDFGNGNDAGNGRVRGLGADHPLNIDANWTTVDYIGGKPAVVETNETPLVVNFNAVNTSLIRVIVTPKENKWTGISELEVYGLEVPANDSFTVSNLKIDGVDKLSEFADNKLIVKMALGSTLPTITAEATNHAAITVVPAATLGGDANVIFTSEDGKTTETYAITFAAPTSAITIAHTEHGTITANKENAVEGDTVMLTVTPDKGYQLKADSLQANAGAVPVSYNRFAMPSDPVTITAEFVPITYKLTYTLDGGTIENPTSYTVETPDFTLKQPTKENMSFLGWIGGGFTERTLSVSIPTGSTGDRSYTAHYGMTYAVTIAESEHGTVTAQPATAQLGDSIVLSVTPDLGYELGSLTVKYTEGDTVVAVDGRNTFGMPAAAVTVTATFVEADSLITYNLNGGALLEGESNPTSYRISDEDITLCNPEKSGFPFLGWVGTDLTDPSKTVVISSGSHGDREYTALYGMYRNITTAELKNGTIIADLSKAIEGEKVTVTAVATEGYYLVADSLQVYETGDRGNLVSVDEDTFTMPDFDVTVTAQFMAHAEYSITYDLSGGTLEEGQSNPTIYNEKSGEITLHNPSKEGYTFVGWTGTGLPVPTKTVVIPANSSGNRGYTALFGSYYSVNSTATTHGTITVAPASAMAGEIIILTVKADSGYQLKEGSLKAYRTDDDKTSVTLNSMTFTMPSFNVTVTAEFDVISSGGGNSGGSSGGSSSSGSGTTNVDGSKTTTTNDSNGTTVTTTYPDGAKTVVNTKKDGTVVEERSLKDGSKSSSSTTPDGKTTADVTLNKGVSGTVALPLSPVTTGKEVTITIKTDTSVAVVIPMVTMSPTTVAVLVKADGTEQIIPMSVLTENGLGVLVDGNTTMKLVDNPKPFGDLPKTHWGSDAVAFAASRQLFNGVGEGNFDPNGTMSRAMLVTVLWRLNGTPAVNAEASFSDVANDAWYKDAVAWAASEKISVGTGAGFDPNGTITREALSVMLYKTAQNMGLVTGKVGTLEGYSDSDAVSDWAKDAMIWAVEMGIIRGNDAGKLDASSSATRVEAAAILQRFVASRF